jgi:NodT family efflux transporter outer membrane factor (OMF) lipoprotein
MNKYRNKLRQIALPILLAALTTLLAGCAAGPKFQRPTAPVVDRYLAAALPQTVGEGSGQSQHLSEGATPDPQWWRQFHSDALDQLVQRALRDNRSLASATATLEQAQELLQARTGSRLPQLNGTAGSGRQKYGAQFLGPLPKPPPFTYFSIGATVSYTLDYTGGVGRAIEQQRAFAEYQQHQLDAARLAVTGNTVMQAVQAAALRAQIHTVEELLDRDRETLQLVQVAFDAGSVSRLDVTTAQSQLASDMTLLPTLRESLGVAEHALAVIVGSTPAQAAVPALELTQLTLPAELPISVPSELAHRRPDILAAEAQLHVATAAVGIAAGNLYPHLTLSASTGQQSIAAGDIFNSDSKVWSLAAGLVGPLFNGGTLRAEKRAAVAGMQANAANYEQTVLTAFAQVADSLQALDQGAAQLQAQAAAESAGRETSDMTRKAFAAGEINVLQVLDAERRYQQARLGYVRAQAQRYIDTVQLFLALGPGE